MKLIRPCCLVAVCVFSFNVFAIAGNKESAPSSPPTASENVIQNAAESQEFQKFVAQQKIDLKSKKPIDPAILKGWKTLAGKNVVAASHLATYNMNLQTEISMKEAITLLQNASQMKTATVAQKKDFKDRIALAQQKLKSLTPAGSAAIPVNPVKKPARNS